MGYLLITLRDVFKTTNLFNLRTIYLLTQLSPTHGRTHPISNSNFLPDEVLRSVMLVGFWFVGPLIRLLVGSFVRQHPAIGRGHILNNTVHFRDTFTIGR